MISKEEFPVLSEEWWFPLVADLMSGKKLKDVRSKYGLTQFAFEDNVSRVRRTMFDLIGGHRIILPSTPSGFFKYRHEIVAEMKKLEDHLSDPRRQALRDELIALDMEFLAGLHDIGWV